MKPVRRSRERTQRAPHTRGMWLGFLINKSLNSIEKRGAEPSGLLHTVAWADDTVWLGGSQEDAAAIAGALPAAEDGVALGSNVSKMHVLRTWMEGQRIRYGAPSVWMNGVRLPVPSESAYIRSLGRHYGRLLFRQCEWLGGFLQGTVNKQSQVKSMGRSRTPVCLSTPEDKDRQTLSSVPRTKGREEPLVFTPPDGYFILIGRDRQT